MPNKTSNMIVEEVFRRISARIHLLIGVVKVAANGSKVISPGDSRATQIWSEAVPAQCGWTSLDIGDTGGECHRPWNTVVSHTQSD
mmetsp:Transcript_24950/g.51480  ORF Transcript_24950/g.51480 Transcript_24950/m.51480 type:complete len:86 (+) Transcript_24950:338-595(+)